MSVSGLTDCNCFITAVSSLPSALGSVWSPKPRPVNRAVQCSEARGVAEFVNRECQRIDRLQFLHHSRVFTSLSAWARTVTKTHATLSTEQRNAQKLEVLQSSSTVSVSGLTDCNCFITAVSSLPSVLGHARSQKPMPPRQPSSAKLRS